MRGYEQRGLVEGCAQYSRVREFEKYALLGEYAQHALERGYKQHAPCIEIVCARNIRTFHLKSSDHMCAQCGCLLVLFFCLHEAYARNSQCTCIWYLCTMPCMHVMRHAWHTIRMRVNVPLQCITYYMGARACVLNTSRATTLIMRASVCPCERERTRTGC